MARSPFKWIVGAVVVAGAVTVAVRTFWPDSEPASGGGSAEGFLPPIGSDTWPPVPTNPDRVR